ncbi:hypothetical protein FB566_5282 [Stackebrandtia endophytica]|uniref:Actinobacteria/chloroflexi VLRF1 release factor domain-containing protein n=1 Tax=Stackebrandtia endophytica TaxID=1496996 RepID=A0A543B4C7_9ACTN|nr:acVLRF1 family peptidyl-tRNA hydrolase [Stackebrandtia endophytica]TQL79672.1 hypothetical protein FB566_5282 [Stackebrandtia endophytica]
MSVNRPAAGGGREILVTPERAAKWIDGFDRRHSVTSLSVIETGLRAEAADGAVAECSLPLGAHLSERAPRPEPGQEWGPLLEFFAEAATRSRRVGAVIARRGAFAVGVFDGDRLITSKVDTTYVQGRTAAGGWSQQRYARRRSNQANKAASSAAAVVDRILSPLMDELYAVVTAGDRELVTAILADPRLEEVRARVAPPHWGDVAEPRLATLKALPERFRTVRIHLTEPGD